MRGSPREQNYRISCQKCRDSESEVAAVFWCATCWSGLKTSPTLLGDLTDRLAHAPSHRFALPVGAISAVVAKALLLLIAEITNVVFSQRFSSQLGSLQHNHLGAWVILAPVAGALVIGLMARFGSEEIRRHGIAESLEAILLGGRSIEPKVAVLKPISSAISSRNGPSAQKALLS
jgi:chloride channel protein, CIC family